MTGGFDPSLLHGQLTRAQAVSAIVSFAKDHGIDPGDRDGLFLIREKLYSGTVVLSVYGQRKLEHHIMSETPGGGGWLLNKKPMKVVCQTLSDVVTHLRQDKEQLRCRLRSAVPPTSAI